MTLPFYVLTIYPLFIFFNFCLQHVIDIGKLFPIEYILKKVNL